MPDEMWTNLSDYDITTYIDYNKPMCEAYFSFLRALLI